jgi:penicillin-binding protein 1A
MPPFRADILNKSDAQKRVRLRWVGFIVLTIVVMLSFAGFTGWRYFFADIPALPADLDELWTLQGSPSQTLLDKDGKPLASRGPRYGRVISLSELPAYVPQAFLAIEDQRFYTHHGVDFRSILRAAMANAKSGKTRQGGSTITQQLIKVLLLTPRQTLKRKVQELWLAMALERRLSKTEILQLYLNRVYFGSAAYGIEAASQRYFSKPAAALTLQEAALLAALPKAPSRLAPDQNRDLAQLRANRVLMAMQDAGYITQAEYRTALATPPGLVLQDRKNGYGYVFDVAAKETQPLIGGGASNFVIFSTIDPRIQDMATAALQDGLVQYGKSLNVSQGAIVVLDLSGAIRAMVGGLAYSESKFNRATQALRQPGSAFKPFVYAAALEKGVDVDAVRYDEPVEIDGWEPKNYGGKYRGRVTLRDAFKRSINTVAVQLTEEIGPAAVTDIARRFGIEEDLLPLPSIALGAQEVNLLELTRAYAVFANDGLYRPSYLIKKIEDTRGKALYTRPPFPASQVFAPVLARQMTLLMQEVVLDGTGRKAALAGGRQAAGKTGTSQDWRDAWFVGFTADYVVGVWIGNDDNHATNHVTGGGLPAQLWHSVMTKATAGQPKHALSVPPPQLRSEQDEKLAAFYSSLTETFRLAGASENDKTDMIEQQK